MKTMMFLLLGAMLFQTARAQSATAQDAKGRRPLWQPSSAESPAEDPSYQRLTPAAQAWVTQMSTRLDSAIDAHDMGALERLALDAAQRELTGARFCGDHTVDRATKVDAFEHSGNYQAVAVRWLGIEPGIAAHSAIFTTSGRCVAIDGVVTKEGQVVAAVMPNSLAVSAGHGLVAYEAQYWPSAAERDAGRLPHRGIFIEYKLIVDVNPDKSSAPFSLNVDENDGDFHWDDVNERIVVKPGVALVGATAPAPPPAQAAPKQAEASPAKTGCADAKQSKPTKSPGGFSLPGALGKVLQKIQPCPATTGAGQGAKN